MKDTFHVKGQTVPTYPAEISSRVSEYIFSLELTVTSFLEIVARQTCYLT